MAFTWIRLGNAFLGFLLALVVLESRTRIMTQHLNLKTISEFFGQRFCSKRIKIASYAITFLFLSSTLTLDFIGTLRKKKMSEKKQALLYLKNL